MSPMYYLSVIYISLVCIQFGIEVVCEESSHIVVSLNLRAFRNPNDIKANGRKCEKFHQFDQCDPIFKICFGNKRKYCNLIRTETKMYKNKRVLTDIFHMTINLPMSRTDKEFYFYIEALDHDRFSRNDLIGTFTDTWDLSNISDGGMRRIVFSPVQRSIHMEIEILVGCDSNWFGQSCKTFCRPSPDNYNCHQFNGSKICLLQCRNGGYCGFKSNGKEEFECVCPATYEGDNCELERRITADPRNETVTAWPTYEKIFNTPKPILPRDYAPTGGNCSFPFSYKGHFYSTCIRVDSIYYWCSQTDLYQGDWLYCTLKEEESD